MSNTDVNKWCPSLLKLDHLFFEAFFVSYQKLCTLLGGDAPLNPDLYCEFFHRQTSGEEKVFCNNLQRKKSANTYTSTRKNQRGALAIPGKISTGWCTKILNKMHFDDKNS